jgi:uncharacterized protein (UPF0371 family)
MLKNGSGKGFDTKRYASFQLASINSLVNQADNKLYIEFGGKILDDHHSARVLPGYDPDAKLKILKAVSRKGGIIFVASGPDIIRGRIRGDFKITYDKEIVRVVQKLRLRGLPIHHVALCMLPLEGTMNPKIIAVEKKLHKLGIKTYRFFVGRNGKDRLNFGDLKTNPFVNINKKIITIISPGGGSGKFGVCLNQLYHEMARGVTPQYLKFETFPVHDLPVEHPINLAFMAASADFYDQVMRDIRHGKATSYNRDIENYELLRSLAAKFPKQGKYLRKISSATHMGVNKISKGIIDDEIVQKEAAAEIARRVIRYKFEVAEGKENPKVVARARKILKML